MKHCDHFIQCSYSVNDYEQLLLMSLCHHNNKIDFIKGSIF